MEYTYRSELLVLPQRRRTLRRANGVTERRYGYGHARVAAALLVDDNRAGCAVESRFFADEGPNVERCHLRPGKSRSGRGASGCTTGTPGAASGLTGAIHFCGFDGGPFATVKISPSRIVSASMSTRLSGREPIRPKTLTWLPLSSTARSRSIPLDSAIAGPRV